MSIRFYDEALLRKIKSWVKDPNMRILPVDETTRMFQMRAALNDDKPLTLPMIAISRDPDMEILVTQRRPMTYEGAIVGKGDNTTVSLNAIPIKLSYKLDIYTRYFDEADEYARNFLFNFINYPDLRIMIPYNGINLPHESTVLVDSSMSNNSDIPERLISGQFSRITIGLYVDDAYLFSAQNGVIWKLEYDGIGVEYE